MQSPDNAGTVCVALHEHYFAILELPFDVYSDWRTHRDPSNPACCFAPDMRRKVAEAFMMCISTFFERPTGTTAALSTQRARPQRWAPNGHCRSVESAKPAKLSTNARTRSLLATAARKGESCCGSFRAVKTVLALPRLPNPDLS
jgi:hypothetical protein